MLEPIELVGLSAAFFIIAMLYSSVGFGGGSSYLAILALLLGSFFLIRSSALLCNLVVVSGSCVLYYLKGHLLVKKFLPFIITSIPLAFLGASIPLKETIFFIILGAVLIISALALVFQTLELKLEYQTKTYSKYLPYFIGGGIGLLSGLVGIGGGIFLAPILNYLKWERPIVIAALASFFILVNSISGVFGLFSAGTFEIPVPEILFMLVAVLIGGQVGVRLSLSKLSGKMIRLLTSLLVLIVGVRVLLINGLQIQFS